MWCHELEMSVVAMVLPDTANVLSLGMLTNVNGWASHWIPGQPPYLEKFTPGKGSKRIYLAVLTNVPYCCTAQAGPSRSCLKQVNWEEAAPVVINLMQTILEPNRARWASQGGHIYIGRKQPLSLIHI